MLLLHSARRRHPPVLELLGLLRLGQALELSLKLLLLQPAMEPPQAPLASLVLLPLPRGLPVPRPAALLRLVLELPLRLAQPALLLPGPPARPGRGLQPQRG